MTQLPNSSHDGDDLSVRVRKVVKDCLRRRATGEAISDDSLIAAHPDLMPELVEELRKLQVIAAARNQAVDRITENANTRAHTDSDTPSGQLEVRCPSCHAPMEVASDTVLTDLTCSACGSHFSLVDQSKATRMAPSLSTMGRFELIERIGVGGFGSVWKARDKELDRTVALKIPRQGAMTAEEQEKFFREARAAAQLKHPSIVSVHEVGRDGDSIYIVSDFVRGVTLSDWLTGQQLTSCETAGLCAKIAEALHHAHEHGVVHRDLKPANIMIDYDGQPHLMDFGLARRDVGEVTVTVDGQVLGTPAYMSPEQAQGEAHTADRRSDVYSLGVILFQFLTGELPFRGNARMLIYQVINDEPPSPRKLNANISKDLETIALKCLEKDPNRRYQSASELSAELKRYMSGEPILSRPIGRMERGWRWCKGNPGLVGAASTVAAALALVAAFSLAAAIRVESARRDAVAQRDRAEAERQRAERASKQARQAVDDWFTAISENQLIDTPGLQPLRRELLQRAAKYYDGFSREQGDDPTLEGERAAAFFRVGNINTALGEVNDAETAYGEALKIRKTLARKNPAVADYQSDLAQSYNNLAILQSDMGRKDGAEILYRKALEIRERLVRENPAVLAYQSDLAASHNSLAILQSDMGRLSQAEASNGKALEICAKLARNNPTVRQYQSDLAFSYTNRGNIQAPDLPGDQSLGQASGRLAEAQVSYGKAVEIQAKLVRDNPTVLQYASDLALSYSSLGKRQRLAGRPTEAEASYQRAIDIFEKLARENPAVPQYRSDLAFSYTDLGNLHRIAGSLAEAEVSYKKVLEIREKLAWENPAFRLYQSELAWAYNHLAATQQLTGRSADAERTYREAIARWEDSTANPADASVRQRALAVLYSQLAKQIVLAGGGWESASEAIAKADALAPRDASVQTACGDAAALLGHWREAADAYGRADEATDHGWHLMFQHAMLELAAGDDAAYRATCRDLVKRHARNEKLNVMLGIVLACVVGEEAVDDWEPVVEAARRVANADPSNPLPRVGLGSALYLAGRPAEAVKVLDSVMPQHALLILVVPDKKDALLMSQLMGETYLAVANRDLGQHKESNQARDRAEQIIARMEKASPGYDEGLALWANRYAAYISKRKLTLFFDSIPVKTGVSAPRVDSDGKP